jgi:hypothetical protein
VLKQRLEQFWCPTIVSFPKKCEPEDQHRANLLVDDSVGTEHYHISLLWRWESQTRHCPLEEGWVPCAVRLTLDIAHLEHMVVPVAKELRAFGQVYELERVVMAKGCVRIGRPRLEVQEHGYSGGQGVRYDVRTLREQERPIEGLGSVAEQQRWPMPKPKWKGPLSPRYVNETLAVVGSPAA